ncbi:hypothetical protein NG799_21900 [Laspinema sp. D1]|uniref:Uncharacterized protein n=1 Tax=Laspinema palackyanum D2a TaxID=2953684 RepID=A0ABT2MW35_9CYAN|nr:hypothetical protein [Laspinema sp. D2a]
MSDTQVIELNPVSVLTCGIKKCGIGGVDEYSIAFQLFPYRVAARLGGDTVMAGINNPFPVLLEADLGHELGLSGLLLRIQQDLVSVIPCGFHFQATEKPEPIWDKNPGKDANNNQHDKQFSEGDA